MTEEIIIDVSNCSHKSDDDCMEVPICNEYGDLMGYQSCEAQTLCPYRSQKKIERLEQENKELKEENSLLSYNLHLKEQENEKLKEQAQLDGECIDKLIEARDMYAKALEEINILAKNYCNACDEFKAKTYKNKNDCLYCNYGFIKRKINEVLNN